MDVTVGTFNLNNLFSRFNFEAELEDPAAVAVPAEAGGPAAGAGPAAAEPDIAVTFKFVGEVKLRTFKGRLVEGKSPARRKKVADRIKQMNLDVLAFQEVEDITALRQFDSDDLGGLYPFEVLIEGNDDRLIDVGILSRLPIGAVTSWQHAIHPAEPGRRVFSRDLLEVEILTPDRKQVLFRIFNNHLKSRLIPAETPKPQRPIIQAENDARRRRQAETAADIIRRRTRPKDRFIVVGDMNDPPDSQFLKPLVADPKLKLVNGLADPRETRPFQPPAHPPAFKTWTYRFKETGKPPAYDLFDQIWLSPALAPSLQEAVIDRRVNLTGDGSDHDPAWVKLQLQL